MTIKRLQSPDPLLPTQGAASVLEPHTSLDSLSTVDPYTRAPASPPEHPQTSSGQASPLGMSVSGTPLSLTPGQILSALDNELELQASDHKNLISALEGTDLSHDNSFSTTTTRSARKIPSRVRSNIILQMIVWILVLSITFNGAPVPLSTIWIGTVAISSLWMVTVPLSSLWMLTVTSSLVWLMSDTISTMCSETECTIALQNVFCAVFLLYESPKPLSNRMSLRCAPSPFEIW